jgi:hypothetical protein
MSTDYIAFDSTLRDREAYANPHYYELSPSNVSTWFQGTQNIVRRYVILLYAIIPYHADVVGEPLLYLDVHCINNDIPYKIKQIDGNCKEAKFVLTLDKIVNDSGGDPAWLYYKSNGMSQVMPFKRGHPIQVKIFDRDGVTLIGHDADYPTAVLAAKQTFFLIGTDPYNEEVRPTDTY